MQVKQNTHKNLLGSKDIFSTGQGERKQDYYKVKLG
jgi:hypothetical protein